MRICFIFLVSFIGYLNGKGFGREIIGILSGLGIALGAFGCEFLLLRIKLKTIFMLCLWLIIALAFANGMYVFIKSPFILLGVSIIFGYLGAILIYKRKEELLGGYFKKKKEKKKLLDTSVIIDGRIADVIKTGFLDGEFILPRFVLEELTTIADSPDPLKRNRGRRGFEILKILKKETTINVEEDPIEEVKEVDRKLVILAKKLDGAILTCDYNLGKVASIDGVSVLNINELMLGLKPAIVHGEIFSIQVIKEGKEFGQGLGYLEDGTMVIIEDGSEYLGKRVKTEVINILQNPSGRMVFAKVIK